MSVDNMLGAVTVLKISSMYTECQMFYICSFSRKLIRNREEFVFLSIGETESKVCLDPRSPKIARNRNGSLKMNSIVVPP